MNIIKQLRPYRFFISQIHGERHWAHVHRFAYLMADALNFSFAQRECAETFAWTHDLARQDDGGGNIHAIEGAAYFANTLQAEFPQLDRQQQCLVKLAICHHSDGMTAEEAYYKGLFDSIDWPEDRIIDTIGCCWDADRLDLFRLHRQPHPDYMSTTVWQDLLPLAKRFNHI